MDLLISDDETLAIELGSKSPWIYQKLDGSAKKALSEYVLVCRRAVQQSGKPNNVLHDSYEFDRPHLGSILVEFRKKLNKLNRKYGEFDTYHLAIIYDEILSDSLSGLPKLMASMMMIQNGCDKTFSKVYVLNHRTIIELDLDNHRMIPHCRKGDGWDALRIEKLVIDKTQTDGKDIDAEDLYEGLPNVDITTNPHYIRRLKMMEYASSDLVPDGNGGLKIRDIAEMMRNGGDRRIEH